MQITHFLDGKGIEQVKTMRPGVISVLFALVLGVSGTAWGGLQYVETADGIRSPDLRSLVQYTHTRMVFDADLERVAVGNPNILEVELLSTREILLLSQNVGRTSLLVWYPDGTTETFLFSVIQDLSVLQDALQEIHPAITIELAPDRAALVLRGTVPTMEYRRAADAAARDYLGVTAATTDASPVVLIESDDLSGDTLDIATLPDDTKPGAAVINLIKVTELPLTTADKIERAAYAMGATEVRADRVMRGELPDDRVDTFLLSGEVENQIELIRVLNVAAQLIMGPGGSVGMDSSITAVADEAGAVLGQRQATASLNGSAGGQLFGSGGGGLEDNDIRANIARSKLLTVANGRIISTINVRDLPQIRVSVQMHEVSRSRLKSWRPDLSLVSQDYQPESLAPGGPSTITQTDASQRYGAGFNEFRIDNALQVLGGQLTNHLQFGDEEVAFDLLFSLLETDGISRTLSRPTLTVLSGEPAVFQVGGEVPVPNAFAPPGISGEGSVGFNTGGVFSGTSFRSFGVQLLVRPMVDERGMITMDIRPTVSVPDTGLTAQISGSTGSPLNTTAFNTRSLQSTARVTDGEPFIIAGLVSRAIGEERSYTPGINKAPILGGLTETSDRSDDDVELVIVVTPTVIRDSLGDTSLWDFPDTAEILERTLGPGRILHRTEATHRTGENGE